MSSYNRWTKEEIQLLKKEYPLNWPKNIVHLFPMRNLATIVTKALELGLMSSKTWKKKEDAILKKYFQNHRWEEIKKLLPQRSVKSILAHGERMGLKRNRKKPRLKVNEDYFNRWSPKMAYILGFILADGCIVKGSHKGYSDALSFGVQTRDKDILEKIKKELSSEHSISKSINGYYCLSITSQRIVNSLKMLKIKYRKSLREKIPPVPEKFKVDFIRGVIDGDGSVRLDKAGYPTISLCGGKNTIIFTRNYLFKKLGVYSQVRYTVKNSGNLLYLIAYRCNTAQKVMAHLYKNAEIYLDRKFHMAQSCFDLKIAKRNNNSFLDRKIKRDKLLGVNYYNYKIYKI